MKILISGASIAGPSLAYWLGGDGHDVTVVERAPALREGGYAVDVRGPAIDVLDRMGVRDALRPLETDTLSNAVVDGRGRVFGRTPRGFGVIDAGDVEIHRGDLARVLYEASRARADYRFGDGITALEDLGDRVRVTFSSGRLEEFDAVIGADGVHSQTRRLAFGPERAFVRPMGSCMAIFTVPNHLGLDREQLMLQERGRVVSVKCANENRDLKIAAFFASPADAFDPRDVLSQRELVANAFADAGWELPRFLEAMWEATDFYADITCQVRMDRFFEGRVALVGDAAYCPSPLSGQGTSLALVGAYALAAELGSAECDPRTAFARYDRSLRAFVARNQDVAKKIAKGFMPESELQAWTRNVAMKLLPYLPAERIMKLAMREVRDAAHAMTLPAWPVAG